MAFVTKIEYAIADSEFSSSNIVPMGMIIYQGNTNQALIVVAISLGTWWGWGVVSTCVMAQEIQHSCTKIK